MKYYKKYPNRRLYDIAASCYVTVDDLRIAIAAGESISVVDSKTEKDLTRNVLLQVISEQEGEGHQPILTNRVLEHLIRFYGDTMNNLVSRYIEQSIISFIEQQELYNKRMKTLSDAEPVAMIKKALEQNIEFWTNVTAPKARKSTPKRNDSSK
jgi:polyhydroxyalkanoate synthesis repressor PhaR